MIRNAMIFFVTLSIDNPCLHPLLGQCVGIAFCRLFIDVVFLSQPLGHLFCRELVVGNFLPKVGGTLVKDYDIAEIDVLLSFCNDDLLAANCSKIKSVFFFFLWFMIVV